MKMELKWEGKVRSKDTLVWNIRKQVQQLGGMTGVGQKGMRVVLCPLGYLDLEWTRESGLFGQWKISGTCVTTPAGPGFHKAAVDFLEDLKKKDIKNLQVQDSTGYWENRDFNRLVEECFYPWLTQELRSALAKLEQSSESVPLFWEEDEYQPEEVPGTVYTPVGRFSGVWLQQELDAGELQKLAQRLFLWPNSVRDALYFRNSALKRMWQDCCFAPSERNFEDERVNKYILENLEMASHLNPSLPLPIGAYRELCIMAGQDFRISEDVPEMEEAFEPGYHKGELLQSFERLWLPLPGVYRYEWSDDGQGHAGCRWLDEDSESPVWLVIGYRNQTGQADWNADMSDLHDVETLDLEAGKAHWGWKEIPNPDEPEEPLYQALGEVAAGDTLYVVTVTYSRPEEREDIYARLRRMQVRPKK